MTAPPLPPTSLRDPRPDSRLGQPAGVLEKNMKDQKRLLTKKEAAEYCSVSPRTVQRWIHNGVVSNVALTRHVRIDRLELDRLIESLKEREVA